MRCVVLVCAVGLSACASDRSAAPDGTGTASSTAITGSGDTYAADSSSGAAPVSHGPFGDGSRLRAQVLHAEGGAFAFHSFYDTELEQACRFFEVAPNDFRCVPQYDIAPPRPRAANAYFNGGAASPYYYVDAACTEPAIATKECHPSAGTPVAYSTNAACEAQPPPATAAHVGEQIATAYYYFGGECVPRNVADTNDIVRALVDDPIESFVHGDVVDEDGVRRLVAEDGAHLTLYVHDDDGQPCEVLAAGVDQCVPPIAATYIDLWVFGDADCTEPAGYSPGPCTLTHAVSYEGEGARPVLEAIDAPFSMSAMGVCSPADVSGHYYRLGELIPPAELHTLTRVGVGDGAVQTQYHVDPAGEPALAAQWWLTGLDVPCTPTLSGGDWWCLPPSILRLGLLPRYADPKCTVPVLVWHSTNPTELVGTRSGDPCAPTYAAYEAVELQGTVYYLDSRGACIDDGDTDPLVTAGRALPLSSVGAPLTLE